IPWVDVATGSLGQGLPYGVGMAIAGKRLDKTPMRTWVLVGDSEMAEGSQWEAFEHAAYYELDNIVAILDINRLGQRGETMHGWDLDSYANRARAFGWHAIEIDGHDIEEIDRAYGEALATDRPVAIVARTIKGKGVKAVEDQPGWHGKALDNPDEAIEELGGVRNITIEVAKPETSGRTAEIESGDLELPTYEVGEEVATRKAYGEALAALGKARGEVVAALRAVHGPTVLPPCDANQTAKLVPQMADREGIVYLRTLRPNTPVIYDPDQDFEIGGSRTLREGEDIALVGAGVTVHEALKAADALAEEGIEARVIDLYSIKPLDEETIRSLTTPIVTVEDHWAE